MTIQPAEAPTKSTLITSEEFFAMGDIGPCELIDGRVVKMSPTGGRHGLVETVFSSELHHFVRSQKIGYVLNGEIGIVTRRNPDRVRGADIAFWTKEQLPDGPPVGFIDVAPYLVIEIVSPGNSWEEIRQKITEYFAIGTDRVWIVEPANRAVLVYRSATEFTVLNESDTIEGEGPLAGFALVVADLFNL